MKEVELQ